MQFEKRLTLIVWCIGLLILVMPGAFAQDSTRVRGHFESDSIRIGKTVMYTLTARYPRATQVVFPDSVFSFAPFEISKKIYFPTKTVGAISYDSVVYYLTTFEIDNVQILTLPIFVLQNQDCVKVFSKPDSIFLSFSAMDAPDSVSIEKLPLKSNTSYQQVSWLLNYPILLIALVILLILLVLGWILFGKRIRKHFAIRRLNKDYQEFITRFTKAIDKLGSGFSSRAAEDVLVVWKRYVEDLERSPYTKFTSREIVRLAKDNDLDKALRSIDRGIYGGFSGPLDPFKFLQSYSHQRFQKKEAEVKNG
ncbi:hypothetical protein BH10BAC4_BH10BAC4_23610 [soil metagenome]